MLTGALRGGALAGGAAALGRGYRDTRLLNPAMGAGSAVVGTAKRIGGGLANFGKRQIHGLTGAFDRDAIGMAGNASAAKKVDLLGRRTADELKHAPTARHAGIQKAHDAAVKGTLEEGRGSQALADAGITTLPGIAKSLSSSKTRGTALRAMGKSVTDGSGGVAMSLGVPLAMAAPSLAKGDETATGGMSMGKKVRNIGINAATGAAFGGLPIIPQLATGIATDYGLGRIAKARAARAGASQ